MLYRLSFHRLLALLLIAVATSSYAYQSKTDKTGSQPVHCKDLKQFTFSWAYRDACNMLPRGGTSKGAPVTLDPKPHSGWLSLQEEGLSHFERDRRAILAMAGPYRTSFDFLEVVGYSTDFKPDKPYQSWGTEYVYVVEDRGNFISLQHIMVMYFRDEAGKVSAPMVMKHWRQDWQYEAREILTFTGDHEWQKQKIKRKRAKGTWSQSVYQVDDSPRYASYGQWEHTADFSSWVSQKTWRPLPRREHSVRQDYDLLEGYNRHTIVPNGWVHEEENYKVKLDSNNKRNSQKHYLAKELGLNRYERIIEHDFSAGDLYWQQTSAFWGDVRAVWSTLIDQHDSLNIKKIANGVPMFLPLFEYANSLHDKPYQAAEGQAFIQSTLKPYYSTK